MAREYDRTGANSGSCSITLSTPLTMPPITIAGWFYLTDDTYNVYNIATICDSSSDVNYFALAVTPKATPASVVAITRDSSGSNQAATTSGASLNQWHHGCAVFRDIDDRGVYIDGAGEDTDNGLVTPSAVDRIGLGCLGRLTIGQQWNGSLAEVGVWNLALATNELRSLAAGYSPLVVRRQNLASYWPLIRKGSDIDNPDVVGRYNATDYNGPSDAAHCRVIYSAPPLLIGSKAIKQPSALLIRAIEKY